MSDSQTHFKRTFNVEVNAEKRGVGFGFFIGIGLVLIGGGLLLDTFNIIEFSSTLGMWWPSLLMIVAVVQLASGNGSMLGSGILFLVGAMLQANKFDWLPGGFWSTFWPVILILVGISFIGSRWKKKDTKHFDPNHIGRVNVEGSRVDKTAIFTGFDTRVGSKDFTGGELNAIFGGIEIDLRDAVIQQKTAILDVTAIFGGVELHVPPEWNVITKGTPIFGGIDDKSLRTPADAGAPVLMINATAIFGGIEIH